MENDREKAQQHQPAAGNTENPARDRTEQFNELSETSLEERMAIADQIGIPVNNIEDAVATGAMRGSDDTGEVTNNMEEENSGEETER